MRVHEYIEKNIDVISTLVKVGAVSPTYLNQFRIYCLYKSSTNIPNKMSRYYFVSDAMRISTLTVQKAVKAMESVIPRS